MHPKLIFNGDFPILTLHIDSQKRATVPALISLMQEAAMQNVIDINLSLWDMANDGISWVLMRMHLHIVQLPVLGESINITTHGAGFEKIFTYRDYRVKDQNGETIAYAPSTWLLMDTKERKMVRIPQFVLDHETPPESECLQRIRHKLPPFEESQRAKTFQVGWHDLDFNHHLSNVKYVQWMLENVDAQLLENGSMKEIDIFYKAEANYGDEIVSEMHEVEEGTFMHRLIRQDDSKELALAKTVWNHI